MTVNQIQRLSLYYFSFKTLKCVITSTVYE
ncbi:unnamed protein product [Acanthoscelides obtectus]|uniref:Uncharacterized protein n=1 Tax=Acanthoscelides obtectus TaxID=200917 RepID=A0A9P0PHY6_ACAOB|nr:unnamed protein product [Acanthoscelides obtectus]CAK1638354.1 hypothetical protein AOBTE_LOCUS10557 [Acanthoscelides obtectus]